jgi:hypothetical protein
MRLCLPLPSLARRRSKEARLEPEEEEPFTYFTVEPSQTSPVYSPSQSTHSNDHHASMSMTLPTRSLLSIPKSDRFRSVYAWLQSQDSVVESCSGCPESPDSHYACTDVTRSAVSYCPDRGTYGSCIPDRGTFSPERRGTFTAGSPPDRCRSAAASFFYYSSPDHSGARTPTPRFLSAGSQLNSSTAGSLAASSPCSNNNSGTFERRPERPPLHVRTASLPSQNTEYIYLDFGGSRSLQSNCRSKAADGGSWHVTRKPVQSPVRRSYA